MSSEVLVDACHSRHNSSPGMNSRINLVKSRSLPAWVTAIISVVIFFRIQLVPLVKFRILQF